MPFKRFLENLSIIIYVRNKKRLQAKYDENKNR